MLSLLSTYYLWLSVILIVMLIAVVSAGVILSASYLSRTGSDVLIPLGAIVIAMLLVWLGWVLLI